MNAAKKNHRVRTIGFAMVGVTLVWICAVFFSNMAWTPPRVRPLQWSRASDGPTTRRHEFTVLTWNLGYAGLGKESNFALDGGTDWLAPSRQLVEKNLHGITHFLSQQTPDIFLLQEVAKPGVFNRRVDMLGPVAAALDPHKFLYAPDLKTHFIPPPLNLDIGLMVFARQELQIASESRLLPLEPSRMGIRKHYQFIVNRIPAAHNNSEWVIINTHLAAFDEQADIRQKQLTMIRDFAVHEFSNGHYVIIGGDWNMVLVKTTFPHTTDQKYLFWVHDLPENAFPAGWQIVADPTVPSVRTVHTSYTPGANYMCVIDGFVASPNVQVQSVTTTDLGFEYSDHNPVIARFMAGH